MPARGVKHPLAILLLVLVLGFLGWEISTQQPAAAPTLAALQPDLVLATTASMQGSGLLNVLLPSFEKRTGYRVKTVAAESRQALATRADILLVHSLDDTLPITSAGTVTDSDLVISDDLVIVGPLDDPARLQGKPALEALRTIASTGTTWVSRRDGSDTNLVELQLWQATLGRDAQHEGWYVSTHAGMTTTLAEANRRQAYTISDRLTFLTEGSKLHMRIVAENDPLLRTPYKIVLGSKPGTPGVNTEGAEALAEYLSSKEARQVISTYGVARFGRPLFTIEQPRSTSPPGP